MGDINQETFICIDCETTGLDTRKDRIIEVAAAVFTTDEILSSFETLIDPQCPIPAESTKIHNITDEMVIGKPLIETILPDLLKMIGCYIIVGHAVTFDIDVILNAAKNSRIPCKIDQNPVLDTLRMARIYGDSPTNSLEELRKHFNIQAEGAHRAMNDVIVNIDVFKYLAKRYKTTKQIFDLLKKPIQLPRMPLGQHKGRPFSEVPLSFLKWAADKDFDRDLLFSIRQEIRRRKKGDLFSQATNPFMEL